MKAFGSHLGSDFDKLDRIDVPFIDGTLDARRCAPRKPDCIKTAVKGARRSVALRDDIPIMKLDRDDMSAAERPIIACAHG